MDISPPQELEDSAVAGNDGAATPHFSNPQEPCADPPMAVDDTDALNALQSLSIDDADDGQSSLAPSEPVSASSTWVTNTTQTSASQDACADQADDEPLRLTDFEVQDTLGTGTFGKVLLVRYRRASSQPDSLRYFALKVLRKSEIVRLRQVEHVKAEKLLLSRVRHPFIVDLYATFQDSVNVYMLLSYVPGGELFSHLRRAKRFTPDVTRFYLATIVLALKHLHKQNIVYRDLKPENLLLDARGYLRLTDFGFAKYVEDRTWTLCGTPEYLAPEVIQSEGHGKAVDWWACGILMYEMLVGYPPFFDDSAFGIYEKILRGRIHWPREMDPLSRELIREFLHPDLTKRLGNLMGGAQDVQDHPWFRGVDWNALERAEIRAPLIPYLTGQDDTRNYTSSRNLPVAEDLPGMFEGGLPAGMAQAYDPDAFHFLDF